VIPVDIIERARRLRIVGRLPYRMIGTILHVRPSSVRRWERNGWQEQGARCPPLCVVMRWAAKRVRKAVGM